MKRTLRVIGRSTPATAAHAAGFSANGESQFSRRSAQGQAAGLSTPKRPQSYAGVIQQNASRIGRLQAMLKVETNIQLRLRIMRELQEREKLQDEQALYATEGSRRAAPELVARSQPRSALHRCGAHNSDRRFNVVADGR